MKKITRLLTVSIILLIGLVISACTSVDIGKDTISDEKVFFGSTLTLNGVLSTVDFKDNIFIFEQIRDDFNVTSDIGGNGTYSNGQLSFSIGEPDSSSFKPINDMFLFDEDFGYYMLFGHTNTILAYHNLNYSDPLAEFAVLHVLRTPKGGFTREYASIITQNESAAQTLWDAVFYVYVDRDVTITAEGTTLQIWSTIITGDLDIDLKAGWNAIHYHSDRSTGQFESITSGNPSHLIWGKVIMPDYFTEE